jgi:hypothetical protein
MAALNPPEEPGLLVGVEVDANVEAWPVVKLITNNELDA